VSLSRRIEDIPKSGIREVFDLAENVRGCINLGIGEPDFQTPQFVKTAAKRAIDLGLTRYTSNGGMIELRRAIARKLKKENSVDADPEKEIIVTAGCTQAILVALACLLDEGDEVLIPTPGFTAYFFTTRIAGGVPVEVPMREQSEFDLEVDELREYLTSRTKAIIINSPCNPTGGVLSSKRLTEIAEFAFENHVYLVSDEIYEKYLYDNARHFSPASVSDLKRRIITVNGLSKTFAMTGWRVGYALADENIVNAMLRYNTYNSTCIPAFVQMGAIAALGNSQNYFEPIRKRYDRRRVTFCEALDKYTDFDFSRPKGAFYVFPKISGGEGVDSSSFCKNLLLDKKVATIPGSAFGKAGEGHVRMSYSLPEEKLERVARRIGEFCSRL
jgi:aminotransferase